MKTTGDIVPDPDGTVKWRGGDVIRTTYPSIMFWPGAEYDLPLKRGDPIRVGRYVVRVLDELPNTAEVLLIRERGRLTDLRVWWYEFAKRLREVWRRGAT